MGEEKYSLKCGEGKPNVTVTSAIHGNEYSGFQVNMNLYAKYLIGSGSGTLESYPICNPSGFVNNTRQDPYLGDLNRNPLKKSALINKIYKESIKNSDFFIDLHSWNSNSIPFALVSQINKDNPKSEEMAEKILNFCEGLKLPLIIDTRDDLDYLIKKTINKESIPSIIIELGPHKLTRRQVNYFSNKIIQGIKNLNTTKRNFNSIYKRNYISSDKTCKVYPLTNTGEFVEKGEAICKVIYQEKEETEYIKAPEDGFPTAFNHNNERNNFNDICHFAESTEVNLIK